MKNLKSYVQLIESLNESIWDIISHNDIKKLIKYLDNNGDLDVTFDGNFNDGHNLLTFSINYDTRDNNEIVFTLLDAGVDPKQRDNNGFDALLTAIDYSNEPIINILLDEYHMNINSRNNSNESGLSLSILNDATDIIKILLDYNISWTTIDTEYLLSLENPNEIEELFKEYHPIQFDKYIKMKKVNEFNI